MMPRFLFVEQCDHPATVPYDKHSGRPYRVIYGCLDGGLDQSLWQYTQFTETLQARNPQLVMMKTAMKLTKSTAYSMMLLGEAVDRMGTPCRARLSHNRPPSSRQDATQCSPPFVPNRMFS